MKKVYSLLIAFIATTFIMYSQSYYYDSFDYPVGNLGLSTGPVIPAVNPATSSSTGNWNYGSTKSAKVQVGSLTYPGLLTSVTSLNDINLVNTGSAVDERMVLTATTITTPVYFSFIMKVKAVPAASTRLASLRGTTNGSGILAPNVKIAPRDSNSRNVNDVWISECVNAKIFNHHIFISPNYHISLVSKFTGLIDTGWLPAN